MNIKVATFEDNPKYLEALTILAGGLPGLVRKALMAKSGDDPGICKADF